MLRINIPSDGLRISGIQFIYWAFLLLTIVSTLSCKLQTTSVNDNFNEKAILPHDEAPHFKNSLEWWYFTGHLSPKDKPVEYGIEFVFFHFNPFNNNDFMMANMAITDTSNQKFYYDYQVTKLEGFLQDSLPLNLSLMNKENKWFLQGQEGKYQLKGEMTEHPGYGFDLKTTPDKPLLLHGGNGYENYGGYAKAGYYSYPRLKTQGTLKLNGKPHQVEGALWYDRQWNCISIWEENISWKWIAIQFNNSREELMLYRINHYEKKDSIAGGTFFGENNEIINLDGDNIHIKPTATWKSPESGKTYPVAWQLKIPELGYNLKLKAAFPQQEIKIRFNIFQKMHYWEGKCEVSGTKNNVPVSGKSYVEITNQK